jgi:tetratricopeptide (TPR) repeat protein
VSCTKGQSGSSVILHGVNSEGIIVAIHKGNTDTLLNEGDTTLSSVNYGVLLSPELIKALQKEAKALGADPFLVWSNKQGPANTQQSTSLQKGKTAEEYFQEGYAMEAGREDDKIEAYRRCIALDPMHARAHSNIGLALYNKGQLE